MGADSKPIKYDQTCGEKISSACVNYTGTDIPSCLNPNKVCVYTINDVFNLQNKKICELSDLLDITDLVVCTELGEKPQDFKEMMQFILETLCSHEQRLVEIEQKLENALNLPIDATDLDLSCLPENPCNPSGTYTTIKDLFQAIITKICT